MKKVIILLYLAFIEFATMSAQDTSEHLTFKGIVIDGSMERFCKNLKAKGFKSIERDKDIATFKGNFTGRNATIVVMGSEDGEIVYSVIVLFAPSGEWNTLVNTYDYYKSLYIQKYGNPTFSKEYNPANSDSNDALMAEVYQETVVWRCRWNVIWGVIELGIIKSEGIHKGEIMIRYLDSQNAEIKNQIKNQKDLEDI